MLFNRLKMMGDLFDVFENPDVKASGSKRSIKETIDDEADDDFIQNILNTAETPSKKPKVESNIVVEIDNEKHQDEEIQNNEEITFTPRVVINELETKEACLHEVVTPIDLTYVPLRDLSGTDGFEPAKQYQFTLDPFQKEAILCIENNQSVLGNFFY